MTYVSKDSEGNINGVYKFKPKGIETVKMSEKNKDLISFRNRGEAFNPKDAIKTLRDNKIYGGITVNGFDIDSDQVTQNRIAALSVHAASNPDFIVKWNTDNGQVPLNADTIKALSIALLTHVQLCFNAQAALNINSYSDLKGLQSAFEKEYKKISSS